MPARTTASGSRKPPFGKPVERPARFARAAEGAAALWADKEVQRVARVLRKTEGVHGVALGVRRKAGTWIDEPCISVFVERKWPKDRLKKGEEFGKRFPKVPIDVVEIGVPRVATIDAADNIIRRSEKDCSAITAVLSYSSGTWLLACGHGVVPDGVPVDEFMKDADFHVTVYDDWTTPYCALVYAAEYDGVRDVSLLLVDGAPKPDVAHPLTRTRAPYRLRTTPVHLGLSVKQYSPRRKGVVTGSITALANSDLSSTALDIYAPNGTPVTYPEIYVVASDNDSQFAISGDSGALVTDDDNHVIGTVVGKNDLIQVADGRSTSVGFVLPLTKASLSRRSRLINLKEFFR